MNDYGELDYEIELAKNLAIGSGLMFGGVVGLCGLLWRCQKSSVSTRKE